MPEVSQGSRVERVSAVDLAAEIARIPALSSVPEDVLRSLGEIRYIHAARGADLFLLAAEQRGFWLVFEGSIRVIVRQEDGSYLPFEIVPAGRTAGEVPLLMGKTPQGALLAQEPTVAALLGEDGFWRLMFSCPDVRRAVLGDVGQRLRSYQSQFLRKEKLITLGALTAGLMHELNNPGAAALRAAAQLRENLTQLQRISLHMCKGEQKTEGQVECLRELQRQALEFKGPRKLDSLAQADAEEQLADWLEEQGIENAWKLAPTLSAIGMDREALSCAGREFPGGALSDPLNWVGALISSVELVGTVEESIARMTDLVRATKKYGYEEKAERHKVDLHDGIQSTLMILGHKFREKQLQVTTRFAPDLPPLSTCGRGLNQVWTNLLDNAIDALPEKGEISVRTWVERPFICIAIADNGSGIAPETRDRIFEPFFTTKEAGAGTGLGLDIVQRIVVGQFGGRIEVQSEPGHTEFTVMLPIES